MITIKLIRTEEFYPTMLDWAKIRNFPLPPLSFLPTNTVVAFDELDEAVYGTCIYNTDSEVMWIGWEISNPKKEYELRAKSFNYILKYAEEYAKVNGYKHVITTSATPPVEFALNTAGFLEGDKQVNQYIKNI